MTTPFDNRTWIAAAKRFVRLRRQFWLCFLGGAAVFACCGSPVFLAGERMNGVVRGIFLWTTGIGFVGCWVGATVAWHGLSTFPCPRCGSTFIMSWTSGNWPTSRCKHCRLDLRPAAMATPS